MPTRAEITPGSHPEEPNEYPLKHLAIAIEPHEPWTDEEISLAANLLNNFADIATSLGVETFTIYSENPIEAQKITANINEENDHIPLTFQSPHERAQIVEAVKKMRENGITPDDVTEEMIDSYLPPKPDLIIKTQATYGENQQEVMFTLPGTVMSTVYSEYAVVQSGFLDMTVDDVLAAIQEYLKRERPMGGKRKKLDLDSGSSPE